MRGIVRGDSAARKSLRQDGRSFCGRHHRRLRGRGRWRWWLGRADANSGRTVAATREHESRCEQCSDERRGRWGRGRRLRGTDIRHAPSVAPMNRLIDVAVFASTSARSSSVSADSCRTIQPTRSGVSRLNA